MVNVKVLRLKDIIRYLIGIFITILIIYIATKIFSKSNEIKEEVKETQEKTSGFLNNDLTSCIGTAIPIAKNIDKQEEKGGVVSDSTNFFEQILKTQIGSIEDFEELKRETLEIAEENTENNSAQGDNVELAKTGIKTEVITNNPIKLSYNTEYGNVKIKNETSYNLTEEMLKSDISIDNKNILLFSTHTCESYTSSDLYPYTQTGNFRTTDLNFSVARVASELKTYLQQYNYNVIHNQTYHDYPAYNGSYTRSLETVQNELSNTPCDIIFDVHRDAIGSRSDYAPIVKIGDNDVAAQIMFVIGTNDGGTWHPNWNQNLKFAIKVQQKAEEMYPGLFKPITLTKYRYNQHAGKYASIIEVGATGNTLEQSLTSMKYLSKVLDEVLK